MEGLGYIDAAQVSMVMGTNVLSVPLHHLDLAKARSEGVPRMDDHDGCPWCGCILFSGDSWDSFGGTTEGQTTCELCGYTQGWADLSAVI